MGLDRLADHHGARAEVITSMDISCLLQLEGLATRNGFDFRMMHIAELLASSLGGATGEATERGKIPAHGPR
jgi:L-lactate dehydrogenase complex protein LldE